MKHKNKPSVAVIIPTFNEPALLKISIKSLLDEQYPNLMIHIINAGKSLDILEDRCIVYNVSENYFWGHSMAYGFKKVIENSSNIDYIFLFNADVKIVGNAINKLVEFLENNKNEKFIAACPVYNEINGTYHLFKAYETSKKLMAHRCAIAPWNLVEDAPLEPILAPIVGGQGVLIPIELAKLCPIDDINFPHYGGDTDLWFSANKKGYKIFVLPDTIAVEMRDSGGKKHISKKKFTLKNMLDSYSPYSIVTQWRLSRKHLSFPLAICSILMFSLARIIPITKIIKNFNNMNIF